MPADPAQFSKIMNQFLLKAIPVQFYFLSKKQKTVINILNNPKYTFSLIVWSTGITVIIQDKLTNPSGAVPIHVASIPKLFPFEVEEA